MWGLEVNGRKTEGIADTEKKKFQKYDMDNIIFFLYFYVWAIVRYCRRPRAT